MTKLRIENWGAISGALMDGHRGLPGGSSLAKILEEHRGVRNEKNLPDLTIDQILKWVDEYVGKNDKYPNTRSGEIEGTDETWNAIEQALRVGSRGFPVGSSLAKFLQEHRRVYNKKNLPKLTIDQILIWIDEYNKKYNEYPKAKYGEIEGTNETWSIVDGALMKGRRGLPGKSSLKKLRVKHGRI